MFINSANLTTLFGGFKASFSKGFKGANTAYAQIATVVPSSTREEGYGWLGQFPRMREWVGDRVVNGLSAQSYKIANRDFEQTISAPRNDVEDDQYGIFAPMFEEMGRVAAELPDELVFGLLADGFAANCYDGQFFFDTDHPVLGETGQTTASVSNFQGGSGTPWFLLDCTRPLKPLIYQERRPLGDLVAKTDPGDENVFWKKEHVYGSDGRCNAGFGFWQMAYASRQPLTAENYASARAAMTGMRGDYGRKLGLMPDVLVVPTTLEGAGRRIVNSALASGGETNEWAGTAKLLVTPWL